MHFAMHIFQEVSRRSQNSLDGLHYLIEHIDKYMAFAKSTAKVTVSMKNYFYESPQAQSSNPFPAIVKRC